MINPFPVKPLGNPSQYPGGNGCKQKGVHETTVKRCGTDLIHKKIGKYIQIGNGSANGSPQHGPVSEFSSRYSLTTSGSQNDLSQ
ncbi:MAG: hypothetical protein R2792_08850 [Saprospiraceae bacterium]